MRFSLQDIPKSIQRRGGGQSVSLHFLRPGEYHEEITRLLAYHEQLLGQPQRLFSQDEAQACVGDYRLANCLIATLSYWYSWRTRPWAEVVAEMGGNAALAELSPVRLRLALYDHVNASYQGFLSAQKRQQALETFAAHYQVSVSELEALLVLDSESEALLTRTVPQPPTPQEVATLYNQWAFEAALCNASAVRFSIDCAAFARLNSSGQVLEHPASVESGIGAVIKRLCYLARRMGVYYDLAYEEDIASSTRTQGPFLSLTLYGPQDVTGAPQQYGLRLARLCRVLLGYALRGSRSGTPEDARPKRKASLSGAIVSAEATVHFLQRSYTFAMDAQMLRLLPAAATPDEEQEAGTRVAEAAALFDSGIEQIFCEAFQALASSRGVDGWRLEREPEPLLLERSIFIPDFAFTRGTRRIYVEILGFWTPSYRERKIQKLQQLQGRDDLLLAVPDEAKNAFAAIAEMFPIVYYEGQLGVTDVLQVLRQRYDDFAQRLAGLDVAAVRAYIHEHGMLAEADCYERLHCYRRSEIHQAAERVCTMTNEEGSEQKIMFVPGLGLYDRAWLQKLQSAFISWLQAQHSAVLSDAVQALKQMQPVLQSCEDATLGTLLELWPEVRIRRDSIFDAVVELVDGQKKDEEQEQSSQEIEVPATVAKTARKTSREKRTVTKKRLADEPETVQGNLWGM